jgi:hypothetical protein
MSGGLPYCHLRRDLAQSEPIYPVDIVSGDDGRAPGFVGQIHEQLHNTGSIDRIQGSGGLVGDGDGGPMNHRTRDRDSLAFADREVGRQFVELSGNLEPFGDCLDALVRGYSEHATAEPNVLPHRQIRQQPSSLQNIADRSAPDCCKQIDSAVEHYAGKFDSAVAAIHAELTNSIGLGYQRQQVQ